MLLSRYKITIFAIILDFSLSKAADKSLYSKSKVLYHGKNKGLFYSKNLGRGYQDISKPHNIADCECSAITRMFVNPTQCDMGKR